MINHADRMLAINIEPCESVSPMRPPIDHDPAISIVPAVPGFGLWERGPAMHLPIKTARIGTIIEQLAQPLGCEL